MTRWAPLLKLLLAAGLLVFLFRQFGVRVTGLVGGIRDWHYVLAACALSVTVVPFLSASRWQLFLRVAGIDETVGALWRINWISMFHGLLLPSSQGFDLLRIYHIERRHPDQRGLAGGTVLIERMLGLALLCVLSLSTLRFVADSQAFVPLASTVVAVTAATAAAMALVLSERTHGLYAGRRFANPWLDRVFAYLSSLHGAIAKFPYRRVLASSLVLIVCFQLCTVASVYLLFRAYGYEIPLVQHVALYPAIAILSMVPITVGGLGVREGFFVYFYSRLGVPADVAIGVSIFNFAVLLLLPALLGGLLHLWETLTGQRSR
jgi:hypothetical protein